MDDTPRTDWLLEEWDYSPPPKVMEAHAKELERELEAANKRIRRLEEVGDLMATYAHVLDWKNWREAKEALP